MTDAHRVFFALWPDESVANALHAQGRALLAAQQGRPMQRDSLHLTLAFLGCVESGRLAALRNIGRSLSLPSCELIFDHLGRFARKPLVWAGCRETPACLIDFVGELHRQLQAQGLGIEDRAFIPHVTLLRNAGHAPLAQDRFEPIVWKAAEWRLVESKTDPGGACYSPIEAWAAT